MKSAKVFLCGMYLHLLLSVMILLIAILKKGHTEFIVAMFLVYVVIMLSVLVSGWVSVAMAVKVYRNKEYEKLEKGWLLLKYGSIPFFILNFLYSLFAWFIILVASRGFLVFLTPIPIVVTCTMIFQSGCFGWCYIRYMNSKRESDGKISKIHYVMQVVSILDVISTLLIKRKEDRLYSE